MLCSYSDCLQQEGCCKSVLLLPLELKVSYSFKLVNIRLCYDGLVELACPNSSRNLIIFIWERFQCPKILCTWTSLIIDIKWVLIAHYIVYLCIIFKIRDNHDSPWLHYNHLKVISHSIQSHSLYSIKL